MISPEQDSSAKADKLVNFLIDQTTDGKLSWDYSRYDPHNLISTEINGLRISSEHIQDEGVYITIAGGDPMAPAISGRITGQGAEHLRKFLIKRAPAKSSVVEAVEYVLGEIEKWDEEERSAQALNRILNTLQVR